MFLLFSVTRYLNGQKMFYYRYQVIFEESVDILSVLQSISINHIMLLKHLYNRIFETCNEFDKVVPKGVINIELKYKTMNRHHNNPCLHSLSFFPFVLRYFRNLCHCKNVENGVLME